MSARFTQVGRQRALAMWARLDRSHRRTASCRRRRPSRPQGKERNVVVTMWDWADPKAYLHDEIASDKRNPTVNPNGPIYGAPRGQRRLHAGRRSEDATQRRESSCRCAIRRRRARRNAAGAAVAVLGRRSDLDEPVQRPQLRDGQAGARVDCRAHPSESDLRILPAGFRPSVGEGVPAHSERAARCRCTIPKTKQVTTIDTLLRHPPSELRRERHRCGSQAAARSRDGSTLEIYDETKDEKKAQGWTRVRARHQRQRQA